MFCPSCGQQQATGQFCASCGGQLAAPAPLSRPQVPNAPLDVRFVPERLTIADVVVAGASAVVLMTLFLPWYGVLGVSLSGVSVHGWLYLVLLSCLLLLGYLLATALLGEFIPAISHSVPVVAGTALNSLLALVGLLDEPGLLHLSVGGFLCFLFSLAALAGALSEYVPLLEPLRRHLPAAPGARATSSFVGAPPAMPIRDPSCVSCRSALAAVDVFCQRCGTRR